jgi:hypothetical protein
MYGWSLNVLDDNLNTATSPPYSNGTAALTTGPGTVPGGYGSVNLATGAGGGDGGSTVATDDFDGTPLGSLTYLNYSAYCATNNGQQTPYLRISFDTGAVDTTGAGNTNTIDTIFLEPPYQQASTGNPALTDQGATQIDQWQSWSANDLLIGATGGFWDNLGVVSSPGTYESPSVPGVQPLSAFVTAYPDATIANDLPGVGGIAMEVGEGSPGDSFDGNVANFTIGVGGVDTTYEFSPTSVPEPASFSLIGVGAALLMRRRRRA